MSSTSRAMVEGDIAVSPKPSFIQPSSLLPEIWLLVFPHLAPPDLQSISLTCSTFRYIAQPLLFCVLDVSPFLLSYNAEQPTLRPRKYLTRFLKRLEYYKLPHIAHGVRHCWISPYTRFGFPMRNQDDDTDPNQIIDAAVDALPSFPNLSTLSWHCIDIAPEWWDVIQSLQITNLWLNSSSIPHPVASPLLTIRHLDLDQWPWEGRITNHVSVHEERSRGVSTLALQHVIQPDVIQSISVPRTDTAVHLFTILSETTYHLTSLKVPFSSVSDPSFINALEHCPSLVSLGIFPPTSDERSRDVQLGTFAPSTLPSLTNYEGPDTHVLQFCHQPLQRISLWGFDNRPALCDPEALTKTLAKLAETATANSLKCLALMVIGITHDLLDIFSSFNELERIIVQSQESSTGELSHLKANAPVTSLYDRMSTITLPPRIKHLKFSTRLTRHKLDLSSQEHEAATFMESFASRHPSIQRIEVDYGIYWTGTYSVIWGRIRENSDTLATTSTTATSNPSDAELPMPTKDALNGDAGYSSKSSSKEYILSTVVSTVHPLPLGKLTFTEHRRRILFPQDTVSISPADEGKGDKRFWTVIWDGFRRIFGRVGS
ncbi:hypothetical protein GALMADRAFT_207893 [Galerina marginata CBS 339.88]|uniref:F-box domain-containing protein n=1 Tax=Galerina marginata (strain CBS 339.88) TaxID=685588 RepID=A0A067TCS9_GALM3|nr:hypothetical protein GALMADRAFT_207893 [Galerina marginata CBS 339.88]